MLRILFTGGGTGGHIYPILAVTEELQILANQKKLLLDLRYFGVPGPYQRLLQNEGIQVSKILSSKWRRYFDIRNFFDISIFLPFSIIQAFWKVFWFMPDVLFSKGGPGSLPVVLACRFYRIPIIIHESDTLVGLANRIASRYATRIGVSFASTVNSFQQTEKQRQKVALIGNPIRRSLISGEASDSATAKKIFGFAPDLPLILIIGGSQGATRINDFILNIAKDLVRNFQILHQTGVKNFKEVKGELNFIFKSFLEEEKTRYKIVPYFEKDLNDAYLAADAVVSRASSGSIFEIAAFGKPAILIPLIEDVVGSHQINNAYEYAKNGAAVVIEETNLKPNIFLGQLKNLFSEPRNSTELSLRGEPEKLKTMSEAAKKFSKPEAARAIAEEILELGSRG